MVNPRIADYIQRHRATYTKDALRQTLLQQGYDPAEVEQAFAAVEAGQVPPARLSGRFWLIFLGYIVVLYGLTLLLFGLTPAGLFIVPILAVPLVIAAGISVLVAALSRSAALGLTGGIVMVFVIPFIFLVIIAGSCFAITAPLLFAPQLPAPPGGTIEVTIGQELFSADGASCTVSETGQVLSVQGEVVGGPEPIFASVDSGSSGGFEESRNAWLTISIGERMYQNTSTLDVRIEELSAQGVTGSVVFRNLPLAPSDGAIETPRTPRIDGTLSWRCH